MTKVRLKRLAIVVGIALFALLFVTGLRIWYYGHGISEENFRRITVGMSITEVEKILGGPEGDYTLGRSAFRPVKSGRWSPWSRTETHRWFGTNATIYVDFDGQGRVIDTAIYSVQLKPWSTWMREKLGI